MRWRFTTFYFIINGGKKNRYHKCDVISLCVLESKGGSWLTAESFDRRVYALVREIPAGRVATYGQIAMLLGNPGWARRVGRALSHCWEEGVPCHRVVNRQGNTVPGWPEQKERLRTEGVWDEQKDRANLRQYLWRPV